MDIGSRGQYPASALSNFAYHRFVIDGVQCNSMEGFLQSLKFKEIHIQEEICTLVGFEAKKRGRLVDWRISQTLWWQGHEYHRHEDEYQELLDRAFVALAQNPDFAKALLSTGAQPLTHSIGKSNPHETILTEQEFCHRLTWIRTQLQIQAKVNIQK